MKAAIPVAVGFAIANYGVAFFSAMPDYAHATQITWYQVIAIFTCCIVNRAFGEVKE